MADSMDVLKRWKRFGWGHGSKEGKALLDAHRDLLPTDDCLLPFELLPDSELPPEREAHVHSCEFCRALLAGAALPSQVSDRAHELAARALASLDNLDDPGQEDEVGEDSEGRELVALAGSRGYGVAVCGVGAAIAAGLFAMVSVSLDRHRTISPQGVESVVDGASSLSTSVIFEGSPFLVAECALSQVMASGSATSESTWRIVDQAEKKALRGDFAGANELVNAVISYCDGEEQQKASPGILEIRRRAALVLLATHRYAEAREQLIELERQWPTHADGRASASQLAINVALAETYRLAGELGHAESVIVGALAAHGGEQDCEHSGAELAAWAGLARIKLDQGVIAEARKFWDHAMDCEEQFVRNGAPADTSRIRFLVVSVISAYEHPNNMPRNWLIDFARRASRLAGDKSPELLDALASALAIGDRNREAADVQEKVVQIISDGGAMDLQAASRRLETYRLRSNMASLQATPASGGISQDGARIVVPGAPN